MIKAFQEKCDKSTSSEAGSLVSVILANYNYGRFLAQSIDSVLSQSYQNFELIVVDDGSSDNSREIIESYGDRLIAIFQENSGQGVAFNAAIARSKGEIICFLDSDDFFYPEKLAKVVSSFQKHPEWVQISHAWMMVNREDSPISRSTKTLSQGDVRKFLLKWGKYKSALTSVLAYRREAIEKVLPIPTKKAKYIEWPDAYLIATVPFYGEVGFIDEPLMGYRVHGENNHVRTTDMDYLMYGHELIAKYINETAAKVGITERFDIKRDAEYRTFNVVQEGNASWTQALQILGLALQTCVSLRRGIKESIIRLSWIGICVFFPSEGRTVFQLGLRKYLLEKFLGKNLKD
jgi:glycosyltransferase involved in cell wall biosynthesis